MTSNIIIIGLIIIAVLDTLIGNRIFPGKVEVLQRYNKCGYMVRKKHRFFLLIRAWQYLQYSHDVERTMANFSHMSCAKNFIKDSAIEKTEIYSNKIKVSAVTQEVGTVIWSSKDKKKIENTKEDILKLIPQLTEAVRKGNDKQEELILEKLQRC